jgi:hypothetical protein
MRRDNLQTLYAAAEEGFVAAPLPAFVRRELEQYLDCGLLCRGFAWLGARLAYDGKLLAAVTRTANIRPPIALAIAHGPSFSNARSRSTLNDASAVADSSCVLWSSPDGLDPRAC